MGGRWQRCVVVACLVLACGPSTSSPVEETGTEATGPEGTDEGTDDGSGEEEESGGGSEPCAPPTEELTVLGWEPVVSSDGCAMALELPVSEEGPNRLTTMWLDGSDAWFVDAGLIGSTAQSFGPGTDFLVYEEFSETGPQLKVRGQYGRGEEMIVSSLSWDHFWSAEGGYLVYINGNSKPSPHGELHVFDPASGRDTVLALDGDLDMMDVGGGAMVLEDAHSLWGGERIGLVTWVPYDGSDAVVVAVEAHLVAAHSTLGRIAWADGYTLHIDFLNEAREPIELPMDSPQNPVTGQVMHGVFTPDGKHLRVWWTVCNHYAGCIESQDGGVTLVLDTDPIVIKPMERDCEIVVDSGALCFDEEQGLTYLDRFEGEDDIILEEAAEITPAGPGRFVLEVLHPEQPKIGVNVAGDLYVLVFHQDGTFSLDLVAERMRLKRWTDLYPAHDPQFAFTVQDHEDPEQETQGVLDLETLEHVTSPDELTPLAVVRKGQVLVSQHPDDGVVLQPMP